MKAKRIKLLGIALVLALALTGCNLIGTDYKLQADQEIEKLAEGFSAVVASYEGGELLAGDIVTDFNMNYNQTAYLYQMYGIEMNHSLLHGLMEDTLSAQTRSAIAGAKFDAAHSLSEEALAEIAENAQASYEANREGLSQQMSQEGESREAREESLRVLLYANGMDYDATYASMLRERKLEEMTALLRDEITEVKDDELQQAFVEKQEAQQTSFTDGYSFESAMSGDSEIICWKPEGYRMVKHILLRPADELLFAYTDAVSALRDSEYEIEDLEAQIAESGEGDVTELQAQLDATKASLDAQRAAIEAAAQACLDDVKAMTDEIYAMLEAGEDFASLIEAYGSDPGMQREPTASVGYAVSSISSQWETNFRDAAMALANVGDYTLTPVVSGSGVHIIRYDSAVVSGAVALDEVRDALYAETLESLKSEHAEGAIDGWVEAAAPSYDVGAFEAAMGLEH